MGKYKEYYPHGIMFHRFHENEPINGSVSIKELETVIEKIGEDRIIKPELWIERCINNSLLDTDVCLTFDDCLKSQYNLALPILEKYKIKAFFFLHTITFNGGYDYNELFFNMINKNYDNFDLFFIEFEKFLQIDESIYSQNKYKVFKNNLTNKFKSYKDSEVKYRYLRNVYFTYNKFINKMQKFFSTKKNKNYNQENIWMTKNDIKHLSDLNHCIGLHTHSHYLNFSELSYDKQRKEYDINKKHLEDVIGKNIQASSHPLGSYNNDSISILKSLDIRCSFRSNNLIPEGHNKINPNQYELARNDISNICCA